MRIYHGLDSLETPLQNTVVAIGVFDGVHRGHQEILHQTVREARSQGYLPIVMTFDIHPSELFSPDSSPPYIASLSQRAHWIDEYGGGLDSVVIVHFDHAFAMLSPDAFVAEVARAADVRPSQIYRWRRELCNAGHAGAGFAPVIVSAELRDAPVPPPAMLIEIGGSVVRIAADAPAKLVTAVLRSLAR